MKVRFYSDDIISDVIDMPDDITEDELNDMAWDWVSNNVHGFWTVIEDSKEDGDLINREDAIVNVALEIWHYPNELYTSLNCFENCQELAERALNRLPSAEPEIIRCKDCKHWYNAPASDGYNSCEKDALIRHESFFCGHAKLRGEHGET